MISYSLSFVSFHSFVYICMCVGKLNRLSFAAASLRCQQNKLQRDIIQYIFFIIWEIKAFKYFSHVIFHFNFFLLQLACITAISISLPMSTNLLNRIQFLLHFLLIIFFIHLFIKYILSLVDCGRLFGGKLTNNWEEVIFFFLQHSAC